jgi:transposase-like protein
MKLMTQGAASPKTATGETEGARRATGVSPVAEAPRSTAPADAPDPEVRETPQRRRFSAAYKWRILQQADACRETGDLGALLRREGLYSSNLTVWRRQRDEGSLEALAAQKRGRKAPDPLALENEKLRRENERLQRRLRQAELIIEIQKKASEMLGIPLRSLDDGGSD